MVSSSMYSVSSHEASYAQVSPVVGRFDVSHPQLFPLTDFLDLFSRETVPSRLQQLPYQVVVDTGRGRKCYRFHTSQRELIPETTVQVGEGAGRIFDPQSRQNLA